MRAFLLFFLLGCATDDTASQSPPADDTAGTAPLESWCSAAVGGAAGERDLAAAWGAAHLGVRLLGPAADYQVADSHLVDALQDDIDADAVARYAEPQDDVCYIAASAAHTGAVQVSEADGWAWIVPGEGVPSLPEGVDGVVIDLRDAPAASWQQLADAVGPALGEDVSLGRRNVRVFAGFPSQYQNQYSVYSSAREGIPLSLSATGNTDLPIVVLTPAALGPSAAAVAAGLRAAQRATIVGADVYTAVAESTWTAVGDGGLLWRSSELTFDGETLPDIIAADAARFSGADALAGPGPLSGSAERTPMARYEPEQGYHEVEEQSIGDRRAALLTAHGTLDWFYPYFDVVGHRIDEALADGLAEIDADPGADRLAFEHTFGRFMHSIEDGHGFFGDLYRSSPDDAYHLTVQLVGGASIIRHSGHPEFLPGDEILAVDGQDAQAWYAEAMARHSAASEGYLHNLATRELLSLAPALTVRHADGTEETLSATPASRDAQLTPGHGSWRPSGYLDDLGAPSVYYLNLHPDVETDLQAVLDQLEALDGADALVVDVRNYPAVNHYEVVPYLNNSGTFTSPQFGYLSLLGAEERWVEPTWYTFSSDPAAFDGPIVLLVSNYTVSAAENFSQMFAHQDHVTVVGQQSASTNGNITLSWIPGGLYMYFTGMEIRNPDGSDFHGIGIPVDVEVTPTVEALAAGDDPELLAAVGVLLE